jgi:hypothetical protein
VSLRRELTSTSHTQDDDEIHIMLHSISYIQGGSLAPRGVFIMTFPEDHAISLDGKQDRHYSKDQEKKLVKECLITRQEFA